MLQRTAWTMVWGMATWALVAACSGAASEPASGTTPATGGGLGRVESVAGGPCTRERGRAPLDPDATPTECRSDADCTAGQNGRCLRVSNHGGHGPSLEATRCSYDQCFDDAACGARSICVCAQRAPSEPGEGHACVSGECDVDADCGAGRYCRRTQVGRYCHSSHDECVEETPCGEGRACIRSGDGIYRCAPLGPLPVG